MNIGDVVKHKKDGYIGTIKSIDKIFVHLEDGKHIIKQYAEIIKESEGKQWIVMLVVDNSFVN